MFFLVTIKTIIETYGILFRKFWWLFLLCVGFDILYTMYVFEPFIQGTIGVFWFLLWCLLGFVTFLTVRPYIAFDSELNGYSSS